MTQKKPIDLNNEKHADMFHHHKNRKKLNKSSDKFFILKMRGPRLGPHIYTNLNGQKIKHKDRVVCTNEVLQNMVRATMSQMDRHSCVLLNVGPLSKLIVDTMISSPTRIRRLTGIKVPPKDRNPGQSVPPAQYNALIFEVKKIVSEFRKGVAECVKTEKNAITRIMLRSGIMYKILTSLFPRNDDLGDMDDVSIIPDLTHDRDKKRVVRAIMEEIDAATTAHLVGRCKGKGVVCAWQNEIGNKSYETVYRDTEKLVDEFVASRKKVIRKAINSKLATAMLNAGNVGKNSLGGNPASWANIRHFLLGDEIFRRRVLGHAAGKLTDVIIDRTTMEAIENEVDRQYNIEMAAAMSQLDASRNTTAHKQLLKLRHFNTGSPKKVACSTKFTQLRKQVDDATASLEKYDEDAYEALLSKERPLVAPTIKQMQRYITLIENVVDQCGNEE